MTPRTPNRILNLGILAHVDAGKTSLTERLLYDAGVVDRLGSVDSGDTRTDSLALERRRGITIKTAVASFAIDDLAVNLVDTPGHPDFIAEVERALGVVDGAVLVVSAVEGVQAQTRVILRVLRRMRIPTLLFVNKTDRTGADPDAVVRSVPDAVATWTDIREALAEHDDAALAAFVDDRPIADGTLERLTADAVVLPAFRGSAITGEGIPELTRAVARLLPSGSGDPEADVDATVFAMDRDHAAWVRVHEGSLRLRDAVGDDRVTAIEVAGVPAEVLGAGGIGRVRGLASTRIGDRLGVGTRVPAVFPPPTLAATVAPLDPGRRIALHDALARLASQDPLIDLRMDERRGELSVSLYGEVQKEVIRDTLAEEFGVAVRFGDTVTLHRERPAGRGVAGAVMGEEGNRNVATLEFIVEPAPEPSTGSIGDADGDGVTVELAVPHIDIPLYIYGTVAAFRDAIEEYVRAALAEGPHGWEVADARVAVTRCDYNSPESGAGDFRHLTEELIPRALADAGTVVCEPVQQVMLDGPADTLAGTLTAVSGMGGRINGSGVKGTRFIAGALVPSARLTEIETALPGLTRGEGTLDAHFAGWRPLRG